MRDHQLKKDDFGGFLVLGSPPFATPRMYNDNNERKEFSLKESEGNANNNNIKFDKRKLSKQSQRLKNTLSI